MEYLEFQGEIIDAMFFSTSNGYTEDSGVIFSNSLPYLKSVESLYDEKISPAFYTNSSMSLQEFYERLGISYQDKLEIIVVERSNSNRVVKLKINGQLFLGKDLYYKLGLRSCDFSIEQIGNNVNISTSELNTKEKNLPSLPHTFSNNSNPNKRVEIEIQPCAVLNLVEIVKSIFQKKVFFKLCQIYINHSYSQRYIIAFSYFVAICKQFPFKKIEEYCNYKTYYYAFRQLFRPFIRKNYKKFLNNCISITKICYFVELLSRMFKFKSMERIYIFSQAKDQLKTACGIIMKNVFNLVKPQLKNNFREFCDKIKKNKIKEKDKMKEKEKEKVKEKEKEKVKGKEKEKAKEKEKEKEKEEEKEKEKEKEKKNEKEKEKENEKEKKKPTLNIDIDTLELVPFFQKKKNNSTRINSFMYESFDSKSNYSVHPNSVDNDVLHQLQSYLMDNNKLNKMEKIKINKNLKDNYLFEDDSNLSQDHPKRNNNVKINFLNPQSINDIKKDKEKEKNSKNEDIKNKNNLILDIKKEDTNEFSPLNNNNINNNNGNKNEENNKKNEQKIKIDKIKIIKSNNPETNADTNV